MQSKKSIKQSNRKHSLNNIHSKPKKSKKAVKNSNSVWFYRQPLVAFVASKLLIICISLLLFYYFSDSHHFNLWNRWYSGKELLDAWYLPFSNWDGQHYLLLADYGYDYWKHSQAFFPLYPILIKQFQLIFVNVYWSAMVLNLVLSYGFLHLFYKYAKHYLPSNQSSLALLLLLSYPTAFYLSVFYTEVLFLLLLFGFLYYYDIKKSYLSIVFAILMPLSRPQSAFIAAALLIILLIRYYKKETIDYKYEFFQFAGFAIGAGLYLLFFQLEAGSLWAGIKAQSSFVFDNALINILNPLHFLNYLFAETQALFSYKNGLFDKAFIIFNLLGISLLLKNGKLTWTVFYIMMFYPVASMGYGGSFMRFSLISAPFLILAWLNCFSEYRRTNYIIIAIFVAIQIYFLYRFSLNLWIG